MPNHPGRGFSGIRRLADAFFLSTCLNAKTIIIRFLNQCPIFFGLKSVDVQKHYKVSLENRVFAIALSSVCKYAFLGKYFR